MQYVVFGADGYIGTYIYKKLKADKKNVIGTSRREQKQEGKTAIICIAESNINRCFDNFDHSYNINVTKTKELIHVLNEKDFHVIFFSTDNVFDGRNGNYTEESHTHALNCYGRMKEEMEQYLLENESSVCIFRISKVVTTYRDAHNIFTEWEGQGKVGDIRCVKGNRLSFVAIEDIYQACVIAAEKGMHGIYQIAGDKDFSRAELAQKFYENLGENAQDIREYGVEDFGFRDGRPLNISMSNLKFRQETGYEFTSMDIVIKQYLKNRQ